MAPSSQPRFRSCAEQCGARSRRDQRVLRLACTRTPEGTMDRPEVGFVSGSRAFAIGGTNRLLTEEGRGMLSRLIVVLLLGVPVLAGTSRAQTHSPIAEQIAKTYGLDSF